MWIRLSALVIIFMCLQAQAQVSYWFSQWQKKPDAKTAQEFFMVPGQNVNFTYASNHVIINASGILTNINTVYASNVLNAPWQYGCANLTQWCLLNPLTYTNGLGSTGTNAFSTNALYVLTPILTNQVYCTNLIGNCLTNLTSGITTNTFVLSPNGTNLFFFTNGLLQGIDLSGTNQYPITNNSPGITGLVAYWKLNEGTGTTANDTTSNLFNGTLSGATIPVWGTGNPYNSGAFLDMLDGTSYMDGSSQGLFNLTTGAFSIAVWAIHTNATWGTFEGLVNSDAHTSYILRYNNNGGVDRLELFCAGVNDVLHGPGSMVLNSSWHWIVVSRTNSDWRMYVDGSQVSSFTSGNALDNISPQRIVVGNENAAPNRNWRGYIGEVMIFNGYALTSNDVFNVYTVYYGQPSPFFVKKTGDTMSGPLIISGPTTNLIQDLTVSNLIAVAPITPTITFQQTGAGAHPAIGPKALYYGDAVFFPGDLIKAGFWFNDTVMFASTNSTSYVARADCYIQGTNFSRYFSGNGGGLTNVGWHNTVGITTTQYITDFLVGQITNVFSNGLLVATGTWIPPVPSNALSTLGDDITTLGDNIIVQ